MTCGRLDLLDLAEGLRADDLTPLLEQLRSLPELCQDEPRNLWFATSYALCKQLMRDPRFSSDSRHAEVVDAAIEQSEFFGGGDVPLRPYVFLDPPEYAPARPFLFTDPPDHTRLRRLVSGAFTTRVVAELRPRVEQLVDELLTEAGTRFELVESLAYPLPLLVIMDLLGVDRSHFEFIHRWAAPLVGILDPDDLRSAEDRDETRRAQLHMGPFFFDQAEQRRAEPRDDLLTALVQASDEGDSLSAAEVVATVSLLVLAGHETTVNLISSGAAALCRNRDQQAALISDPGLAEALVEEVLRLEPPVALLARTALEDAVVDGSTIKRGSQVILVVASANRDPMQFDRPDALNIRRANASSHLGFGFGLHHCVGAPLARLEGEITFHAMARRFASMALEEPVEYRKGVVLRGPQSLKVTTS